MIIRSIVCYVLFSKDYERKGELVLFSLCVCICIPKAKYIYMHTFRGSSPVFSSLIESGSSLSKSMILSSIAKKGEIERAFPSLSDFGVDDKTIST